MSSQAMIHSNGRFSHHTHNHSAGPCDPTRFLEFRNCFYLVQAYPDDTKIADIYSAIWIHESKGSDGRRSVGSDTASNRQARDVPAPVTQARADLQNSQLDSALFIGANLIGAQLMKASRADTDFRGARLVRADFSGGAFQRTNMANVTAGGANFAGTYT